jgi:hypothetical protein
LRPDTQIAVNMAFENAISHVQYCPDYSLTPFS